MSAPAPHQPGRAAATRRGILLMCAAVLCFTLLDALAKDLVSRYPVAMILWVRLAVQLAVVLLVLRASAVVLVRTRHPGLHAVRAATQIAAAGCFFAALPHMGLADATALADLNPVLVTLGAALFLGERLDRGRLVAVLAALAGALVIIRPGTGVFGWAAVLPLLSALAYAANVLITRRLGQREGLWTAMLVSSLMATALATLPLPFVRVPVAAADLPALAGIGLFGTVAQLCVIRAFSLAEAAAIAPFSYLGIVFAALWGVLFFDVWPDRFAALGALVIVGAGLYVWRRETGAARPGGGADAG
jgi:drug/metabolite transporter (DMT)-like permease